MKFACLASVLYLITILNGQSINFLNKYLNTVQEYYNKISATSDLPFEIPEIRDGKLSLIYSDPITNLQFTETISQIIEQNKQTGLTLIELDLNFSCRGTKCTTLTEINQGLEEISEIQKLTKLDLSFTNNAINNVSSLAPLIVKLPHLTSSHITLSGNKLTEFSLQGLSATSNPALQVLGIYINNNQITNSYILKQIGLFTHLYQLFLDFSANQISSIYGVELLSNLTKLENLYFSIKQNKISSAIIIDLSKASKMETLYVYLQENQINDCQLSISQDINEIEVNASNNVIQSAVINGITNLPTAKTIKLDYSFNKVNNLQLFQNFASKNTSVQYLYIIFSNNMIKTAQPLDGIEKIASLNNLEIDLQNNLIEDTSCLALEAQVEKEIKIAIRQCKC